MEEALNWLESNLSQDEWTRFYDSSRLNFLRWWSIAASSAWRNTWQATLAGRMAAWCQTGRSRWKSCSCFGWKREPAFQPFGELFDDSDLERPRIYRA